MRNGLFSIVFFGFVAPLWAQGSVSDAERLLKSVEAKINTQRYEQALAELDKVIAGNSHLFEAYYQRGVARDNLKDAGAAADYGKVLELEPKTAMDYVWRGMAEYRLGDANGAAADYAKAIEIDPQCSQAYVRRAVFYYYRGDLAAAKADYDKGAETGPRNVDAFWSRGSFRSQSKDYEGALADYSKAISLDPEYYAAYLNRANIRTKNGDYAGAIADYGKVLALRPKDPWAYQGRGLARMGLGDYKKALADLSESIKLGPDNYGSYRLRGFVHYYNQSWLQAAPDFRKAIKLAPPAVEISFIEPRFYLYLIELRLGEKESADREMKSFLEGLNRSEQSEWPRVIGRFLLGQVTEDVLMQAAKSEDDETARERLCQAHFYAGTLYLLAGNKEAAREHFRKSAARRSSSPAFQAAKAELLRLKPGREGNP